MVQQTGTARNKLAAGKNRKFLPPFPLTAGKLAWALEKDFAA